MLYTSHMSEEKNHPCNNTQLTVTHFLHNWKKKKNPCNSTQVYVRYFYHIYKSTLHRQAISFLSTLKQLWQNIHIDFLAPFSAEFLFSSRLKKHNNNKNTAPDGRRIPCLTTCFHGCLKGLEKHILSLKHNIQKFCPDNKHVLKKARGPTWKKPLWIKPSPQWRRGSGMLETPADSSPVLNTGMRHLPK